MNPYADSDTTHGLLSPASFSRCQSRAPRRRPAGSHHVQQTCKECQRLSLIDPGLWWTLKTTPLHCRRTHGSMERYVSPPLLLKQQESSGTVRGMKPKGDFTDFWQSLFEFLGIFSMWKIILEQDPPVHLAHSLPISINAWFCCGSDGGCGILFVFSRIVAVVYSHCGVMEAHGVWNVMNWWSGSQRQASWLGFWGSVNWRLCHKVVVRVGQVKALCGRCSNVMSFFALAQLEQ